MQGTIPGLGTNIPQSTITEPHVPQLESPCTSMEDPTWCRRIPPQATSKIQCSQINKYLKEKKKETNTGVIRRKKKRERKSTAKFPKPGEGYRGSCRVSVCLAQPCSSTLEKSVMPMVGSPGPWQQTRGSLHMGQPDLFRHPGCLGSMFHTCKVTDVTYQLDCCVGHSLSLRSLPYCRCGRGCPRIQEWGYMEPNICPLCATIYLLHSLLWVGHCAKYCTSV